MEAHEITKDNMHLAIAAILTTQQERSRVLSDLVNTVKAIEIQTTRTNGTVIGHTAEIAAIKLNMATLEASQVASACPKTCGILEPKVRALEDARVVQDAKSSHTVWLLGVLWALITGGGVTFIFWLKE